MGKMPMSAKEMIRLGEKIPLRESIFASSFPALTKTIVPGSIPIWDTQ